MALAMSVRQHAIHGIEIEERFGYWQAVRSGDFIHCAGQVARDESGAPVGEGNHGRQLDRCFDNMQSVLTPLGATLADVVFVQANIVPGGNAAWDADAGASHRRALGHAPAGVVLAVDALNRPEFLAEVSGVAYAPQGKGASMQQIEHVQLGRTIETRLGLSSAVRAGELVFVSGQLPLDSHGEVVEGGLAAEFASCVEHIALILGELEGSLDDVVYTTTYLTEGITPESFEAICDAHRSAFDGPNRPSGTMLYVPQLPMLNAHVLMTAVAVAR